jgi:phosphoglucomutase
MAEEFTFANVQRAAHGIARYVSSQKSNRARVEVIVGRDPRFLGETFCAMAADTLSIYGITPLVIAEPVPTPTISYAVIQSKADGAINFTASHNPPEYNGIKFSTPGGAPALPEVTKAIQSEISAFDTNPQTPQPKAEAPSQSQIPSQSIDPRRMYLSRLREIVDLDVIKKAGIKIAFDPMWGAPRLF